MQLDLSPEERDLLSRLVEREVGETRAEARRSATREYHDRVQQDENLLKALLARLKGLGV